MKRTHVYFTPTYSEEDAKRDKKKKIPSDVTSMPADYMDGMPEKSLLFVN